MEPNFRRLTANNFFRLVKPPLMNIVSVFNEHLTFQVNHPHGKKQNIEDGFEASEFFCNNSVAVGVLDFFSFD